MKIVIDTRMLRKGGIGTYLRCLLPYLESGTHLIERLKSTANIYSAREQIELPWKIPPCDLFWSPHFNVPVLPIRAEQRVLTIHDVYHLDHLETFSYRKRLYAKTIFEQAIAKADQVITVSEFSKSRLLHYFPKIEPKISVIYSGSDHLLEVKSIPVSGQGPFFLCVGSNKPHKNRSIILQTLLKMTGLQLVVVGQAQFYDTALKGRVHFLEDVSEGNLAWLYRKAEALIFPSLYEGWGLPPLEAMQLGCPVIAATVASIPEACGEAALYFDPHYVEELCEKIEELPKRREELILAGKKQASKFSWKTAADQHFQVFERATSLQKRTF